MTCQFWGDFFAAEQLYSSLDKNFAIQLAPIGYIKHLFLTFFVF